MIGEMAADPAAVERHTYEVLERRLLTLLPPEYQQTYEDVQPVSMDRPA